MKKIAVIQLLFCNQKDILLIFRLFQNLLYLFDA